MAIQCGVAADVSDCPSHQPSGRTAYSPVIADGYRRFGYGAATERHSGSGLGVTQLERTATMIDVLLSSIIWVSNHGPSGPATCDNGGGYYDAVHQICQPYIPSDPQTGYGRFCDGGNHYDNVHGVCARYAPACPPPMYPDY